MSPRDRVLPADERLEADDRVGRQLDDRLVVKPQLVALDGPAQVVLEVEPFGRCRRHARLEDVVAGRGVGLRPVEGDLGVAEQLARVGLADHADGDADAGADEALPAVEVERLAQGRLDPVGDPTGLGDVLDPVEQDGELVAGEPGHGVARPQAGLQPAGDRLEETVAGRVAEALVDDA